MAMTDYDAMNSQASFVQSGDETNTRLANCMSEFGLAQDNSMDVTNDPRFFAKSVMDKRLGAFKSLTIVSSLMFGSSMMQCFKLKKDMDFSKWDPLVGSIAIWQTVGFFISVIVSVMCLLSLYVISHQLFYTNRLSTSGPTGFEQASVFYLTRVIVMWRHLAIKCLFNGLSLFIFLVGIQLFTAFYKDADTTLIKTHVVVIANVVDGNTMDDNVFSIKHHHKLNMAVHSAIGYCVLLVFFACSFMLIIVRRQHLAVFQQNYAAVKVMTMPLEATMRQMAHRSGHLLET